MFCYLMDGHRDPDHSRLYLRVNINCLLIEILLPVVSANNETTNIGQKKNTSMSFNIEILLQICKSKSVILAVVWPSLIIRVQF